MDDKVTNVLAGIAISEKHVTAMLSDILTDTTLNKEHLESILEGACKGVMSFVLGVLMSNGKLSKDEIKTQFCGLLDECYTAIRE